MTNDDWSVISAIGTAVSAAVAFVGLPFIGWQLMVARKTADLQSLQTFAKEVREHEENLITAPDAETKKKAFNEFLNLLELNAAALNGKLYPGTTKKIVREKMRDSILVIENSPDWHDEFTEAVTTDTTFSELQKFMKRERRYIRSTRIRDT